MTLKSEQTQQHEPPSKQSQLLQLAGGLLPLVAYTIIEEKYGVKAGLIAGVALGFLEMTYEYIKLKKITKMTLLSNALVIFFGLISLLLNDGFWFKMQPAILEFIFFILLLGSWIIKKPLLKELILAQNPKFPEQFFPFFSGITFRLSLFFLAHALLATYAAFFWSTEAWIILKGVGLTVSMIFVLIFEIFFIRLKIKKGQFN